MDTDWAAAADWPWLPGLSSGHHGGGGGGVQCAACRPARFTWASLLAAAVLAGAPAGLSACLGLKLHRRLLLAAARRVPIALQLPL